MYVLIRNYDGWYAGRDLARRTYWPSLDDARTFASREEAEVHRIVHFESVMSLAMAIQNEQQTPSQKGG